MYDFVIVCEGLSNKYVIEKRFVKDILIKPKGIELKGLNRERLEAPRENNHNYLNQFQAEILPRMMLC